jgi:hypothetical protein
LKERSFRARRRLPDWYDERLKRTRKNPKVEDMMPELLAALRHRKSLAPERFRRQPDGAWPQTGESLRQESADIAALLPKPLRSRTLIVLTPFNPGFLERLTDDERQWVALSFQNGAALLKSAGFHAVSGIDQPFEPADFGDTIHMTPAGGRRLAHMVASAIQDVAREQPAPQPR